MDEWHSRPLWYRQIERQLHKNTSLINGVVEAEAARISDVVEQIHEVRKEVEALRQDMNERVQKMREAYRELKQNGG